LFIGVCNLFLVMECVVEISPAAPSFRCSRARARPPSATLGFTLRRSSPRCSL
jgi:hypothetical protein